MKKTLLSIVALFGLAIAVPGQQAFAEFDLESNNIDDIQVFELGDSLFVTYTEGGTRQKKGFWFNESGQRKEFKAIASLLGEPLLGITANGQKTNYYVLPKPRPACG